MPRIAYVNGRYMPHNAAGVHIEDRGFQFADGVYEVIALIGGHLADEEGHLDRLERSLSELRICLPVSRHALKLVIREVVRRNRIANANIYMQVTRGEAPRDFPFPKACHPALVVTVRPATFDLVTRKAAAKKAVTVPDIRWKRRDIKSTMLLAQVLAKQAAVDKGAHEAWMVDEEGFVTEGSSTNAWIVDKKGNLVTRSAGGSGILKGVTRNALQALCRKEKIKIVERPFTVQEAYQASEAFTTAAVSMVTPIVEIDGKKIGDGKPGDLTLKILGLYMRYAEDRRSRQHRWEPA